jgi:hypothetical protein
VDNWTILCENQLVTIDFHILQKPRLRAIIPSIKGGLRDGAGERLASIRWHASSQADELTYRYSCRHLRAVPTAAESGGHASLADSATERRPLCTTCVNALN